MKLVAGLGNPGPKYQNTRHNLGWMALENLSFYNELRWKSKFKGLVSETALNGSKVHFLMPQTYMNLSGESILALCQFYKIKVDEILVVHDEVDLAFGDIVFKKGGGTAGHNGLKSTAQCLGQKEFKRIRLGVDRPEYGDVADYLLSPFSRQEEKLLGHFLENAAAAIEKSISEGFEKAAGIYSRKNFAIKG